MFLLNVPLTIYAKRSILDVLKSEYAFGQSEQTGMSTLISSNKITEYFDKQSPRRNLIIWFYLCRWILKKNRILYCTRLKYKKDQLMLRIWLVYYFKMRHFLKMFKPCCFPSSNFMFCPIYSFFNGVLADNGLWC